MRDSFANLLYFIILILMLVMVILYCTVHNQSVIQVVLTIQSRAQWSRVVSCRFFFSVKLVGITTPITSYCSKYHRLWCLVRLVTPH